MGKNLPKNVFVAFMIFLMSIVLVYSGFRTSKKSSTIEMNQKKLNEYENIFDSKLKSSCLNYDNQFRTFITQDIKSSVEYPESLEFYNNKNKNWSDSLSSCEYFINYKEKSIEYKVQFKMENIYGIKYTYIRYYGFRYINNIFTLSHIKFNENIYI